MLEPRHSDGGEIIQVGYFEAQTNSAVDYCSYGRLFLRVYIGLHYYCNSYYYREQEERGELGGFGEMIHYFYRYYIYYSAFGRLRRAGSLVKRYAWFTPYDENSPLSLIALWGFLRYKVVTRVFTHKIIHL